MVVVLMTVVLLASLIYLWRDRMAVERQAGEHLRVMGQAAAELLGNRLHRVDMALSSVAGQLTKAAAEEGGGAFPAILRTQVERLELMRALIVVDADGQLLYDSDYMTPPHLDLSDRDYFIAQRDHHTLGLYFGTRMTGRDTQQPFLPLSRRWTDAAGRFGGVVAAIVEPNRFGALVRRYISAPGLRWEIQDRDGGPVYGSPADSRDLLPLAGSPAPAAETEWMASGPERWLATRRNIFDTPLGIRIAVSERSLLARWDTHAAVVALLVSLFALLLAGGRVLLLRQLRRIEAIRHTLSEQGQRLRTIFDNAPEGIWVIDAETRTVSVNPTLCRMLGYTAEEMCGRIPMDFTNDENRRIFEFQTGRISSTDSRSYEIVLQHKDGTPVPAHFSATTVRDEHGEVAASVAFVIDLADRIATEKRLHEAATIIEHTTEGVVITDTSGRILSVNRAFVTITGYTEEEAIGRNPSLLKSGRHDEKFYNEMWSALDLYGQWQGEIWNRRKSGEIYAEWLTINKVRDAAGRISNYVAVFADITKLKQSQDKLEFLAHYDSLTELPNRLLLNASLAQLLRRAARERRQAAVLVLDLDRFKVVNDSLGHPLGDQLLVEVARRLAELVRAGDIVARQGGDEFVVLLEELPHAEASARVAEKMLACLHRPFQLDGHELYLQGSIGICIYPNDGDDGETLLKNADAAMYKAKEGGGNRYRFYTREFSAAAVEQLELESGLRQALRQNELVLHFQPQVTVESGEVVGVEALVRWCHPKRGLIMPDKFIRQAEQIGLIGPLGEWVLNEACATASRWQREGLGGMRIAVNLSPKQLAQPDLAEQVSNALRTHGLAPQQLELEITETALMEQHENAQKILLALKQVGVSIAIDDFGTGYSSLAYLKRFPLDRLKIAKEFVRDLPNDVMDAKIAATIIALGRNLGLEVLAEGVKSRSQLEFLRRERCAFFQGYYFSRPLSADELKALLSRQAAACGRRD